MWASGGVLPDIVPGHGVPSLFMQNSLRDALFDHALVGHAPPPGRHDAKTTAQGVDLFPTMAAVASASVPMSSDGIDLLSAWRGTPIERRPDLFWTYGKFGPRAKSPRPYLTRDNSPGFAIHAGRWNLLADTDGRHAELYDLSRDPAELGAPEWNPAWCVRS